jgi:long-chain acyl-CoA synthetase
MLSPPPLHFAGGRLSADEVAAMAGSWRAHLRAARPPASGLTAMVMANRPEAVALFFALAAEARPLALLSPEPRAWRSDPPLPPGTRLVLHPGVESLGPAGKVMGLEVQVLPAAGRAEPPPSFPACPAVGAFTSGSTGLPRPVWRGLPGLLREAAVIAETLGLHPGDPVLGVLPLDNLHGFTNALLLAALLRSPLGLVDRFDHRSVLARLATERYRYVGLTPHMADILGRCPLRGSPPPAPPVVKVSGSALPEAVLRAFHRRFGVTLLPAYGTSEAGIVAAETGPPEAVRPDVVGRPVRGVEIVVGDAPTAPAPWGVPGRLWVRSPWYMDGYGIPPVLQPGEGVEGWRSCPDLGVVDATGRLRLLGRLDECFKTSAGQLVSPGRIAAALTRHPAVAEAVVIPVPAASGTVIGVVVAVRSKVEPDEVRRHAARLLPLWSQPRLLTVVPELPRLPGGKVDRGACAALLEGR